MHRLRALIWKNYKVRLRSPFSTALDICGPIVIIILYLSTKLLLGSFGTIDPTANHGLQQQATKEASSYQPNIFRNPGSKILNPKEDLQLHLCTKVLFVEQQSGLSVKQTISESCGIELISVGSKDILVKKLRQSLAERIDYKPNKSTGGRLNLSRRNATYAGCFTLANNEPNYQAGIVFENGRSFDIILTDALTDPVVFQPYTQGAFYNEFRIPQSDLNAGLHLLEICINEAIQQQQPNSNSSSSSNNQLKWRIRSFPVATSGSAITTIYTVFILAAIFCNVMATVLRCSEDNETGLHHYIRSSGVQASFYWLSQALVMVVHMFLQSLLISILLSIPTSNILFDPLYESNITVRFLMLLTYSVSVNAHGMFIGSMFSKVSHALLTTSLLATCYAVYPITYLLRWNPYGFSDFNLLINLFLLNPVSNYQAMLVTIAGICMQTNEPLDWNQLNTEIIGGEPSNWTLSELWILLIVQGFFWFFLTILVDQLYFMSSNTIPGLIVNMFNESFACCPFVHSWCGPKSLDLLEKTRTKSGSTLIRGKEIETSKSAKDPNRICCSLRGISVKGPELMIAHTRGDPLKLTNEQLNELKQASKSSQFLVNAARSNKALSSQFQGKKASNYSNSNNSRATQLEEPILLDEAMQQHIIWQKSTVAFDNLNLDFRFNQVSFILGQTDTKELFFATLLGLRPFKSGHIVLDGAQFSSSTLALARPHIGYLGERDIFLSELSIFENLQFFGSVRDPSYSRYVSESQFLLSLLHLSNRRNALPSALTSRSARKLALAVAAVGRTKLLLLVEPTLSLRWKPRCQVLNLLKKYKSIRSIIVDTSDVDEAVAFGDRLVLFRHGRAQLDGVPERLRKNLRCGHWIVFEPMARNKIKSPASKATEQSTLSPAKFEESLKSLEMLTSEMFKKDKLENLDATTRSVYQEIMRDPTAADNSDQVAMNNEGTKRKTTVILKVRHSPATEVALCNLLRMFNQQKIIHNFRLAEMTYESLEDILVLHMSKAIYPDLPPDLLLSLQHRTQRQEGSSGRGRSPTVTSPPSPQPGDQDQPQISVRKHPTPKMFKPIFGAKFFPMLQNRISNLRELFIYLIILITSLVIVGVALISLRISLEIDESLSSSSSAVKSLPITRSDTQTLTETKFSTAEGVRQNYVSKVERLNERSLDGIIEAIYKYRIGLFIITNESTNKTITNLIGDNTQDNTNPILLSATSNISTSYLDLWNGNKKLIGLIGGDIIKRDVDYLADIIQNSKDLLTSVIFFNPKRKEVTVVFEPQLPHTMIAGIRAFINYHYSSIAVRSDLNRLTAGEAIKITTSITNTTTAAAVVRRLTLSGNKHVSDKMNVDYIPMYNLNDGNKINTDRTHITPDHYKDNDIKIEGKKEEGDHEEVDYRYHMIGDDIDSSEGYKQSFSRTSTDDSSRPRFRQSWHEIVRGHLSRRMFYGLGFALAEALTIGVLVIAPIRHRSEILAYTTLIIIIENTYSVSLIACIFITLFIYKLASLPIAYLVSLLAESKLNGFLFVFIIYLTAAWVFSIHLRTFIQWTLFNQGYLYTVSNWIVLILPISSLVDALSDINHISRINQLCEKVPAYLSTRNIIELDGEQKSGTLDKLLLKVQECLENGKSGIDTDVLHQREFGIMWNLFLLILFGSVVWTFLLFSESVFGLIARRFVSTRSTNDPMKTIIRSNETTRNFFKWDREKDRLVSEYIRCVNETKYVRQMASNCLYLRIWLRPLFDQSTIEQRLAIIVEPLIKLGQPKSDIQIELKTTLQVFIKIGSETNRYKVDRIHLMETYSRFMKEHNDFVVKFAIVDWTRETLYKILLHGHYNTKSTVPPK